MHKPAYPEEEYRKKERRCFMNLTEKERGLLTDMKGQEELCIKKYNRYADEAKCPTLAKLFRSIAETEGTHLKTINGMLAGAEPDTVGALSANNEYCTPCNYASQQDKEQDAFLCRDMLSMEKHVSTVYNTGVFEFSDPKARRMLSHIQQEEQQHGEQLYAFMSCNGMYN